MGGPQDHVAQHENWPTRSREFNALLTRLIDEYGGHGARWSVYSAGHRQWFRSDGIHLGPAGQRGDARFVAGQVDRHC